jgi:hypothetical protein
MTPKEKAKELCDKFKPYVYCYGGGMLSDPYNEAVILKMAKQCALIAVDEYIDYFKTFDGENISVIVYWASVKAEIENL